MLQKWVGRKDTLKFGLIVQFNVFLLFFEAITVHLTNYNKCLNR